MAKIVRVVTRLNIGGPAIHVILLSRGLRDRSHTDILICGKESDSEGNMRHLAEAHNIDPVEIPELEREPSFTKDIKAFLKLYRIMRRERPDIVHTHMAKAGTLGRAAAICAGVPIRVHTFHGHVFDGYFSPVKARIFLFIERFLAIFTTRLVAVSVSVREEIVDKLRVVRGDKCVVIPLGLDLAAFFACAKKQGRFRKELGIGGDTILVGIVGRLVPIKNHTMFLDSVKRLIDSGVCDKVRFLVIGDGELRQTLEAYADNIGVRAYVVFTGWRKDLAMVYADLDVVALTSLNEGTPVSIIEAMAAARPVVATDVGGVRDLICDGKNGYLVASGDITEFSGKTALLIRDRALRDKMGEAGRGSVARFSKERLVKDVESLYKGLLSKVKRR